MIMFLINNYCFRGSPIQPAGTSLTKPLHVCSAEGRVTVHYNSASEERKCTKCQSFIAKIVKILSMTPPGSLLSTGRTHATTVIVTCQIPRAQSCSDPDPSLLVWVGGGLSRLYDTGLRGTPLMLSVCLNVNLNFPLLCYIGVIAYIAFRDFDVLDHPGLRVGGDFLPRYSVLLVVTLLTRSCDAATGTGTRAANTALACAAIVLLITGRRAAAVTQVNIHSDTHNAAAAPLPLILTLVILHDVSICYAMTIFVEGVIITDHQTFPCLDLYQACWFIYNLQVNLIISAQIYLFSETSLKISYIY